MPEGSQLFLFNSLRHLPNHPTDNLTGKVNWLLDGLASDDGVVVDGAEAGAVEQTPVEMRTSNAYAEEQATKASIPEVARAA